MMKRYDPLSQDALMRERTHGKYVRYDDAQADKAAALQEKDAEIARLREGISNCAKTVDGLMTDNKELRAQVAELDEQS